jgi:ABC-type Fe3+ transport system permease subunit
VTRLREFLRSLGDLPRLLLMAVAGGTVGAAIWRLVDGGHTFTAAGLPLAMFAIYVIGITYGEEHRG